MPRRPDRAAGLGRNVTMFDTARNWAYPQWWSHRNGTSRNWEQLVLQRCHAINTEFPEPLPFNEVRATAQSIARWIWRNFTEEQYRALQSVRGRKGGQTMTEKRRQSIVATNKRRAVDRAAILAELEA
jgi:hypothetical protein